MKLLTFTAALLACYLLASTARAADKLAEELLVGRAQPATSREGILLTNAHVVRDTHQLADALLGQPFEDLLDNLAREFGSKPPDAIAGDSWKPLARWFILQSGGSGKFKQAQMVLKFDAVESFGQWRTRS